MCYTVFKLYNMYYLGGRYEQVLVNLHKAVENALP